MHRNAEGWNKSKVCFNGMVSEIQFTLSNGSPQTVDLSQVKDGVSVTFPAPDDVNPSICPSSSLFNSIKDMNANRANTSETNKLIDYGGCLVGRHSEGASHWMENCTTNIFSMSSKSLTCNCPSIGFFGAEYEYEPRVVSPPITSHDNNNNNGDDDDDDDNGNDDDGSSHQSGSATSDLNPESTEDEEGDVWGVKSMAIVGASIGVVLVVVIVFAVVAALIARRRKPRNYDVVAKDERGTKKKKTSPKDIEMQRMVSDHQE